MEVVPVQSEIMRARRCCSTPPGFEHGCFGSLGILGVFGLRAGCLSAFGTSPLSGSLGRVTFLSLSLPLSDPDQEVEEFLLVADDDEDEDDEEEVDDEEEEEASPGVGGVDLSESSCTSMTLKLSWLSVLDDVFTVAPPEPLDLGRGLGLAFGFGAAVELDDPASCLFFRICIRRSGKVVLPGPQISVLEVGAELLLSVEFSWRCKTSF